MNRIADLLHVDPELLPERLRRFEMLRRLGVRAASLVIRRMDLQPRPYPVSWDDAIARLAPVLERTTGRGPDARLAPLAARPKLVEWLQGALEERERSTLPHHVTMRVDRIVEASLAVSLDDVRGFHPRPADPVEAFAFVGTRYAARTTPALVDALRATGFGDVGILDLAIAVAGANAWARLHRLLALAPELYYVGDRAAVPLSPRSRTSVDPRRSAS